MLADELAEEGQLARRGGAWRVARLTRWQDPPPSSPRRWRVGADGTLGPLRVRPLERRPPGADEVEIRVEAVGLNFIDVMDALGLLPFERRGGPGAECAGEVTAVGEKVTELAVGDPVVALAAGCFASHVTVPAVRVFPRPSGTTAEEAATLPINFLTAAVSFDRARLAAGEKVLIHSAASGTGLAAAQLALARGAEVYATASPAKWPVLERLGVRQIFPSRDLGFAAAVAAATGGGGVDVVLNALEGDYIARGLEVLAPGGRFVELGKVGVWEPERVHAHRSDVIYHRIDLMRTIEDRPEELRPRFVELARQVEAGTLSPLPRQVFAMSEAVEALRTMQSGRHTGKIVLRPGSGSGSAPAAIRPDRSYLLTGGFGGLGLETAALLVDRGARFLALVGRRAPGPEARQRIRRLEDAGARILTLTRDVSDVAQVADALAAVDREGPPLGGVVHAAGTLDDALLSQQTRERFERVLGPKVTAAWALHDGTAGRDLDFFVLYSSSAAWLGSAGQANHAAANAFLDALARFRHRRGLPASSIGWGPWSGVGAASGADVARRLERRGLAGMPPRQGLAILERLLAAGPPALAAARIDWPRYLSARPPARFLSRFAGEETGRSGAAPVEPALRQRLSEAVPEGRRALLERAVAAEVATVLGREDAPRIAPDHGFFELGMDSLTSVELRNRLQNQLGVTLSQTLAFDYPTLDQLVDHLLREVLDPPAADAGNTGGAESGPETEPEGDIAALLAAELADGV